MTFIALTTIALAGISAGVFYFESRRKTDDILRLRRRVRATDQRMLSIWMLLRDMERASLRTGGGSKLRLSTIETQIVDQADRLGVAGNVADQIVYDSSTSTNE